MTIKLEFQNCKVLEPISGKEIEVISIDPSQFGYYYNNGYDFIFEVDEPQNEKPTNNVISE